MLLLVCAVLNTLHSVKHIINEEECRSIGEAVVCYCSELDGDCWEDEFAVVIATKPPGAVQETLGVLERYKGATWYDITAKRIKSKLCLCISLCRHTSPHF